MEKIDYSTICAEILKELPQRQNQVLTRRFGLNAKEPETLQKIGSDFGITRERVRQLEKSGFLRLKDCQENKNLKKALDYFEKYLKTHGGQKREDILLNELGGLANKNFIFFLLSLADNFYRLGDNETFQPFWTLEKEKENFFLILAKKIKDFFKKEQKPIALTDLAKVIDIDESLLDSCLEIARDFDQGPLGSYGLTAWPEIKPRGVRDAAFLVLKKQGEPLHFTAIAAKAGGLPGELAAKRKMLPQTIHNELIRDPRFVLVGRGIYGLNEWGYAPGTVKEVIYKVLEAGNSLKKEEVLQAVQKQRIVKPNTVFLNLSDKKSFVRDEAGKYSLKIKTA